MNTQKYWLGFSLISGIGPKYTARLLNHFGDLKTAWTASQSALHAASLDRQATQKFLQSRAKINLETELARVAQIDSWLLTLGDEHYPPLLREIDGAPMVLYVRGTLIPEDMNAIAIVGTRKATRYGIDAAYDLAKQLASNGITIISGLAHGIDTAAHQGALDAGGRTIAVLGCGLNQVYPPDNRDLALKIIQQGAVMSEFSIGTPPDKRNFPRRNRVISGLALGVLVIEAPLRSGALITANTAGEQGREVFALPGNIYNQNSWGPNQLIQDGAKLVMRAEDILDELNIAYSNVQTRTHTEKIAPANDIEAQILQVLTADPIHVDDLARQCGLPIATVSGTLTILELKGLARNVGPMQYCLHR